MRLLMVLCWGGLLFSSVLNAEERIAPIIAPISEAAEETPLVVRYSYNTSDPVYLRRAIYVGRLLDMVLSKSGSPYVLEISEVKTTPSVRTAEELSRGHYDVSAVHTNTKLEQELRPIRYPIFRGLTGWRIMFIRQESRRQFAALQTSEQLKLLTAGQGHNWPDNSILLHNGYSLRTGVNRNSLYKLLTYNRIDYFPRGVYQIWNEQELLAPEGVVIDTNVLLRYPTATYFFVPIEHENMARVLEKGFEVALEDGSFHAFFREEMGLFIFKGQLGKRVVFDMDNPNLPPETPLKRKELWFDLEELKQADWATPKAMK